MNEFMLNSRAASVKSLTTIPGVGKSLAHDLIRIGIHQVSDLKGKDPEWLYEELCRVTGHRHDRCVLYAFRCAVYYASYTAHEPARLKWWNWKDASRAKSPPPSPPLV